MTSSQQVFSKNELLEAKKLQDLLAKACSNSSIDALLLSGGIDSSILAALDTNVTAITVVYEEKNLDFAYAKQVTEWLSLPWHPLLITKTKALETLKEVMVLENSYDLSLKGDIPVYLGMQYAKKHTWHRIRTGDAADELFAGYSGVHSKTEKQLKTWMKETITHINPPSAIIAQALQLQTDYPYLDEQVKSFALQLKRKYLIKAFPKLQHGDVSQNDNKELAQSKEWGKIILRLAAKDLLPNEIIWRPKAPLEYGSGFRAIEKDLEQSWKDGYLFELKKENKHFWNKAHACLYVQYKALGLMPPVPQAGEYACSWCSGGIRNGRLHCKTCGAYPANRRPESIFINNR